jgi:hypothetical protein
MSNVGETDQPKKNNKTLKKKNIKTKKNYHLVI